MQLLPITVIGAGSWGTALAIALARNGQPTRLWSWDPKQAQVMQFARCNQQYLPDIAFPRDLSIYSDLKSALDGASDVLIAVPSHAFRDSLQQLKPLIEDNTNIIWATKGLDPETGGLLSETVKEFFDEEKQFAVLSGPSFAIEVAKQLPTAITVAATSEFYAQAVQTRFHCENFRVYISDDMRGVQLGGAVKNVLAIATGMADGLGLGANSRAAIITRGLAEMSRLGLALEANQLTFMGLAGIGDLVLTCTDNQSRNRRFGLSLGSGKDAKTAEKEIGQVVEGVHNAAQVCQLAEQHNVEVPLCQQVRAVLNSEITPKEAFHILMTRAPKHEL